MSQLSPILRDAEGDQLVFQCPGCEHAHAVRVNRGPDTPHPCWEWNGDINKPTFKPSIMVTSMMATPPVTPENLEEWKRAPWSQTRIQSVCHSFVTDGRIQFLGDCTHPLAGQTVDLPPWE